MKNQTFFRILTLGMMAFIFACQQPTASEEQQNAESSESVREIIEEKNAQGEAWFKAGLVDSIAASFAENVVLLAPHQQPVVGIEEFKKFWGQMMQNGQVELDIKTEEVKHSGDLAVERGKFKLNFTPNENSPIPPINDHGNYVVVWEKINGSWTPVWDAPVSELPMSGPPPMTNEE